MKSVFRIKLYLSALLLLILFSISCGKSNDPNKQNSNKTSNNNGDNNSSTPGSKDKVFVLGTFPQDKNEIAIKRFSALKEYLEEKLGVKIKFTISLDYEKLAKDLNDGKIHFASISPSTYITKLQEYPGLKYIATAVDKKTGKEFYNGFIITRKDSGIKTFSQLKNKHFAFVDKGSGSGFKFPVSIMLNRFKVDPKTFFKKTLFMGNHPSTIEAVYKKQAAGGATWDFAFDEAVKKYGKNPFNILVKTPDIPLDTFVASPHLPDKIVKKLQKILSELNEKTKTKSGKLVIKDYYFKGYVVRNPKIYNIIRQTNETLKKWRKKWKEK